MIRMLVFLPYPHRPRIRPALSRTWNGRPYDPGRTVKGARDGLASIEGVLAVPSGDHAAFSLGGLTP